MSWLTGTVAIVIAVLGGYNYVNTNYVHASDYRQDQRTAEIRAIEREKTRVELEVLKLEVKQEVYPAKFDAIDKKVLEKQKEDLESLKRELFQVKSKDVK